MTEEGDVLQTHKHTAAQGWTACLREQGQYQGIISGKQKSGVG